MDKISYHNTFKKWQHDYYVKWVSNMKNAGHLGNPEKWKQDDIRETEQQAAYDRHKKDEAARAPH
jgi:hypothetical protein